MKLEFQNVSKSYGATVALNRFSAIFSPGIHALLGPNGSGKTTLMNILTGNLKPDSGSIRYHYDTGAVEAVEAMGANFRSKLGFMPQYPGLYPGFTVIDFLSYIAVLKNMGVAYPKRERRAYLDQQIHTVLRAVELDDLCLRKIRTLSGGMKQRLALAQAILGDPEILVLDEPTAGLDPKQRILVRNYISQIALNKIVIIATHVVSDVEFIAKDIIMLKKGVIMDMASPQDLIGKMEGGVWLLDCTEEEVCLIRDHYPVINMAPSGDWNRPVRLRVLADSRPTDDAIPASPILEDYYLHLFGEAESNSV